MATPKHAHIRGRQELGPDTIRLDLEMRDEELGYIGGQYVIVDSQRILPNGKAAKRAYSIITPDKEQRSFSLVVKKIGEGLCSNYLHEVAIGDEVRFSGPWGKLHAAGQTLSGKVLVVATDTGISSALGLLSSQAMSFCRAQTQLLWLREGQDVMNEASARALVPEGLAQCELDSLPVVHHPERPQIGQEKIDARLESFAPAHVFMAGDGAILLPYAERLNEKGIETPKERLSCFFNMPKKSS